MQVTFETGGFRALVEMNLEQLREVLRSHATHSPPIGVDGGDSVRPGTEGAETTHSPPIGVDGGDSVRAGRDSGSESTETTHSPPPARIGGDSVSVAARTRDVARTILADGHGHARREISAAVREAGLKTTNLDGALRIEFERYETAEGDPAYRDPAIPAPRRRRSTPDWLERVSTEPPSRDKIEVLSVNGGPPDG